MFPKENNPSPWIIFQTSNFKICRCEEFHPQAAGSLNRPPFQKYGPKNCQLLPKEGLGSALPRNPYEHIQNQPTLNPFQNNPLFLSVSSSSHLKTLQKKEKVFLFQQCFQPIKRTFHHIHQIRNCCLQSLLVWKSLKFVIWERIKSKVCSVASSYITFRLPSLPKVPFASVYVKIRLYGSCSLIFDLHCPLTKHLQPFPKQALVFSVNSTVQVF